MSYPVIEDLFSSIVANVSAAMGYTVHFHQGHMLEIVNKVKALSSDPDTDKRYPLIALRQDIEQGRGENGLEFEATLFIITLSDPLYSADERKELTFKPWLTPIYDELINQIARSGYFHEQSIREVTLAHKFINHYFWGNAGVMGSDANIFGDAVDCIEVKGLKLTAITNSCYPAPTLPRIVEAFTDTTGNYTYMRFNQEMDDPSGNESEILINGIEVNSLSLSGNPKVIIANMSTVEYGDNVTVTIDSETIQSIIDYPVTNNTFQLT